jgi:uncharacterized protein (TIGR03067 family)
VFTIAAIVAASAAQHSDKEDKVKVQVSFSAQHVPAELKAGSRADLVMVVSMMIAPSGLTNMRTAPVAAATEVVSVKREETSADPLKAVQVELRVTKEQAEKIEKIKERRVKVRERGSGVLKEVPIPLRLELVNGAGGVGGEKKDDKKSDTEQLQGEWTVVSVELSGKQRDNTTNLKLVVKGDDWTPPAGGRKLTFKLDTTKSPKWLTLSGQGGNEWPGIYKIEGDTFTFCRSVGPGGERPTEFKGGPGVFLMVCNRSGK